MLTHPSTNLPSPAAEGLAGVARLVRQICLLREQGETGRAARLQETDLAAAVHALRAAHGAEALPENMLDDLFAAERQRVAEAVILAQLLIPQLTGRPPVVPPTPGPTAVPPGEPGHPSAGPPAITDLLDAMLAAERTGRHPSPVVHRQP